MQMHYSAFNTIKDEKAFNDEADLLEAIGWLTAVEGLITAAGGKVAMGAAEVGLVAADQKAPGTADILKLHMALFAKRAGGYVWVKVILDVCTCSGTLWKSYDWETEKSEMVLDTSNSIYHRGKLKGLTQVPVSKERIGKIYRSSLYKSKICDGVPEVKAKKKRWRRGVR